MKKKDGQYFVHYHRLDKGRESDVLTQDSFFVQTDLVILAAGTLGSAEILLRSKAKGLSLSDQVGNRFTGNGDVLGFSYNTDTEINGVGFGHTNPEAMEPVGPCITGVIDLRDQPNLNDGMIIEEGNLPSPLAKMLPEAFAIASKMVGDHPDQTIHERLEEKIREIQSEIEGSHSGAVRNTQTFLVMAHDDSAGKMYLENGNGPLRISWKDVGRQPIFDLVNNRLKQATEGLGGGNYLKNPLWSKLFHKGLITVHPLGGCCMAESADKGVVNHKGQVFLGASGTNVHDGLYVMDGSVIPRSLGVNPLLTITAIAERNIYLLAKDYGLDINYNAPSIPPKHNPSNLETLGLLFTETMKGFFSRNVTDEYQKGFEIGQKENSSFQFKVTVRSDDLNEMLKNPKHQANIVGNIVAPVLSKEPMDITDGQFNLFIDDPDEPETRQIQYRMQMTSNEGKTFYFEGFKRIHSDNFGFDMWQDTTTLYMTIFDGIGKQASVLGKGILQIGKEDFLKEMQTIRILNEKKSH